ncbi:MAG: hypothetical protein ACI8XO_002739 [Verrucomicrobiales bacterium]|jgi:hypothetical protein
MTSIKPSKNALLASLSAAFLAFTFHWQASADTIVLNNGISHEGRLISETPESIRFEVGKSVKQVRTFKRAEIKSLTIIPQDELALPTIRAFVPSADLLDAGDYSKMINGSPKNFLRAFPDSKYRAEVEEIIATLKGDEKKVIAGDVKLDGQWVTSEQIKADPLNHQGRVALAGLKKLIGDGELLNSLRAFDALEKEFSETSSFPAAIEAIKPVFPKQGTSLATQLAQTTRETERREAGYSRMSEEGRKKSEASLAMELAPFLKRHAEEKEAGRKWLDYHTFDLASISHAQNEVKKEQARLDKIDVAALSSKLDSIAQAAALAGEGNYAEADTALKSIGKIAAGTRAEALEKKIKIGLREAETAATESKKAADAAARMKAREVDADDAEAKAKQANITKPIPAPKKEVAKNNPPKRTAPSTETAGNSDDADIDLTPEDGIEFDRTGGEATESSDGGLSLLTVLLFVIPIMGAVTFFSLKKAQANKVEDFVPEEPDEEPEAEEKGVLDDYDNTPLI